MNIIIIAAMDEKLGIGLNNDLPWPKIKSDLKRFKKITEFSPIIMGRKTFESIGKPLKNRTNIVISNTKEFENVIMASDFLDSVKKAENYCKVWDTNKICVIGGASVYKEALVYANELHITYIEGDFNADTFFPQWNTRYWDKVCKIVNLPNEENPCKNVYVKYKRKVTLH